MKTCFWSLRLCCLILTCLLSNELIAQVKITDTVYYNNYWKICEKPVAAYYRVGVLAALNNLWYFIGTTKDYSIQHVPLMEGEYSDEGKKEGTFTFYYQTGIRRASGQYLKGVLSGKWDLYYPDGKKQAEINFPGGAADLQVVEFRDQVGNVTLKDGTGEFNWYVDPVENLHNGYNVKGSFESGKRAGSWVFNPAKEMDQSKGFTQKYNKHGKLVSVMSNTFSGSSHNPQAYLFQITPERLFSMEALLYDKIFAINGDSLALTNLAYYLIEKKPTEVNLRYKTFEVAFNSIMQTLERYKYIFTFSKTQDVDCKLEFRIGSNGLLKDASITGYGVDSIQKQFMLFLLGKFNHVEMPGDKNVAVETNFTVYLYTIDMSEVISGNVGEMMRKELIYSYISKEKMMKYLIENRKTIKQTFLDRMNYHYYRRK